jgi:hypothetical protein
VLARQPGPEVAEQLQVYNSTLKEKNKQIKVRQYRFISTKLGSPLVVDPFPIENLGIK